MNSPETQESVDDLFEALAHVRRRELLVGLLEHDSRTASPEVAPDETISSDATDRSVKMQHVHLPKLEEYGFIEWNRATDQVTKGPNFEEVRPLLAQVVDRGTFRRGERRTERGSSE